MEQLLTQAEEHKTASSLSHKMPLQDPEGGLDWTRVCGRCQWLLVQNLRTSRHNLVVIKYQEEKQMSMQTFAGWTAALKELDYCHYRLTKISFTYDGSVGKTVSKWAKSLDANLKSKCFESFDIMAILFVMQAFQQVHDTTIGYETAEMWQFLLSWRNWLVLPWTIRLSYSLW